MKQKILKFSFLVKIVFLLTVVALTVSISFAQDSKIYLTLGVPLESELSERNPKQFTIQLPANQTARIEVEQTGMDVSLTSFDTDGEKLLEWGLPIGRFGSESLLILAEKTGEYRIDVEPGNRHAGLGKFVVRVTEIRETTEDDRVKNQAAREISRIKPEAFRLARLDKGSSRQQSIKLWYEVAGLARVKEDKLTEARALHAIGTLLLDLDETQEAIDVNLKTLEMWRELKNRRYEMIVTNRFGNIWLDLGEYEKAIINFKETLKIGEEIESRFETAVATANIGNAYLARGQPETAIKYYQEVLPIYVEMKTNLYEAYILNGLGKAYIEFGDYQKGIEHFEKALTTLKKDFRGESVFFHISLGKAYREIGQLDKAYENLIKAKLIAEELGSQIPFVQSAYNLAIIENEKGNLNKALENVENALKIIEKNRDKIRNKDLRASYFATVQNVYELYIDLLVKRAENTDRTNDITLAFEISERSRSRSLVDLLQEARVDFKKSVDKALLQKQSDLSDQLLAKYQIREQLISRTAKQEQIDRINGEINDFEFEAERLNTQIEQQSPRYSDLIRSKTISTKEIQNLLDDETVLLEYKLGERRSFVWLVTGNSLEVFILPPLAIIELKAKDFYNSIIAENKNGKTQQNNSAKDLGEILFSQFASKIENKRLAIVADGVLQYTPFSALRIPGSKNVLADKNEIVVLPSASVLAQIRESSAQAKSFNKTIAIFADPVFDKNDSRISSNKTEKFEPKNIALNQVLRDFKLGETLPRLLASRQEATNISNLVAKEKANLRTGFEANLEYVENENLAEYKILHFATHGLLNTTHPELSGLVLSLYDKDGNSQDGFLSLNDIYNLDLSNDMIVLSACQTALGKDIRGEGLIGLSRGFLYAGSKRIVASLWKVDDSATGEFMKRFYRNHLEKQMSASAALRQTKIEMKKIPRYNSPFYWGAFTLLGDWKQN